MGEQYGGQGWRRVLRTYAGGRIQEGSERRVERTVEVPDVDKVGKYGRNLGASEQWVRGIEGRDDGGQEVLRPHLASERCDRNEGVRTEWMSSSPSR